MLSIIIPLMRGDANFTRFLFRFPLFHSTFYEIYVSFFHLQWSPKQMIQFFTAAGAASGTPSIISCIQTHKFLFVIIGSFLEFHFQFSSSEGRWRQIGSSVKITLFLTLARSTLVTQESSWLWYRPILFAVLSKDGVMQWRLLAP